MHLDDTQLTIEPIWEGELALSAETYAVRGGSLPRVTLGKPTWWDDPKVLGEHWVSPAGGRRYGLARFAFSVRAEERNVRRVEFVVSLHARDGGARPIAFDLLPTTTTEEQTGSRTFSLGPSFKFAGVDASVGKAETTIAVKQAVPVITAEGVGESAARWVFAAQPAHPLVGSQTTYIVVELPQGVDAARADMHLSADVQTTLGRVLAMPPDRERARWSWVLE